MDTFERAASESAALALIRAGNLSGAENRLRAMLSENPNDARALALMAHCNLSRDDDKIALKLAREAAGIDPDDEMVRHILTGALLANKQYNEAEGVAETLAADDPHDSGALFRLAIARAGQKDNIGARYLFDEAEEMVGDDVFDLINLARLRLNEWNYASAASLAQRALALDPNQSEVFRVLGECELAMKRPLDAYELALEALRISPGDRQIMRLMVRARARRSAFLRPFLAGVDWIVEMDRRGLVIVPLLIAVVGAIWAVSVIYDLARIEAG